jgi:hypothetical protein
VVARLNNPSDPTLLHSSQMTLFTYCVEESLLVRPETRLFSVPSEIQTKQSLFDWYQREFAFPAYFGWNWDAFEECLLDLSWIEETRIVIYHRSLPLLPNSNDQKIYVSVLARLETERGNGEPPEVRVVFNESAKQAILNLTAEI